ncbi:phage holin [Candidatus Fukatsuia endosymbiont of Tuberolachnus salignus]|uniref:phage holin n=1 Tax=Candidatus Fukatsuia endosymbiont of Tuberolachnus salignus TaxID=3077957 RepID=UPI00313D90E7
MLSKLNLFSYSILNGLLNIFSPEQWSILGVLAGLTIAIISYLTDLYFKIKKDRHKSGAK